MVQVSIPALLTRHSEWSGFSCQRDHNRRVLGSWCDPRATRAQHWSIVSFLILASVRSPNVRWSNTKWSNVRWSNVPVQLLLHVLQQKTAWGLQPKLISGRITAEFLLLQIIATPTPFRKKIVGDSAPTAQEKIARCQFRPSTNNVTRCTMTPHLCSPKAPKPPKYCCRSEQNQQEQTSCHQCLKCYWKFKMLLKVLGLCLSKPRGM